MLEQLVEAVRDVVLLGASCLGAVLAPINDSGKEQAGSECAVVSSSGMLQENNQVTSVGGNIENVPTVGRGSIGRS